ncbi:MAG: FecR domain-containing protein [Cyclobacteriaceae bacterium]
MADQEIIELLRKHFTNELTDQERTVLEDWRNASAANEYTLHTLKKVWGTSEDATGPEPSDDVIAHLWYEGVEKEKHRHIDWGYYLKIAAVILVVLASGIIFYRVSIVSPQASVEPLALIIKDNPSGQKTKVALPDGSVVWLNGASKISYLPNFNDSIRAIELSGEAYFEVAENPEKPFAVKSGNLTTTALGTSFNIRAYPEQENIQVSLLTGKVSVEEADKPQNRALLTPGNELQYNRETGEQVRHEFEPDQAIGWTKGLLVFDHDSYEEFVRKIERWFGVTVRTEGTPPEDWELTTSYQNEALVNILKNIRYGKPFNYELTHDHLTLKFNETMSE